VVNVSFLQDVEKSIECETCIKWFHAMCEDLKFWLGTSKVAFTGIATHAVILQNLFE